MDNPGRLSQLATILRTMDEGGLASVARQQCGLFTRAQARHCGYSAYQIRRRLHSGAWQSVLGGVLASAGLVITPSLRDRAALLAIRGGVLAGPSAARRHGITVRDPRTFIAVGPAYHPRVPPVRLIRDPIDDTDIECVEGVLVTGRERTVVDCLRLLPEQDAVELLDRALQARWITPEQMAWRAHRFVGRRGAVRLAHMSRLAGSGARSAAERLTVQLLRRAGITGWTANEEIHDEHGLIGVGDVVFRDRRLVVEIGGRAHHTDPGSFQRDRERQNRLVAAGWTVLRFTWRDLTRQPEYLLATIEAMLRS